MSARRPGSGSGLLANTGALLASRLSIAALGWLGTVLIVRTLSVHDYGKFTLVFGVLGVLTVVTDMGIGRLALAGMVERKAGRDAFVGSYILLRLVLGVAGYLLAIGFVLLAGYPPDVAAATAVAGVVVLVATPSNAYGTIFQAYRRMGGVALAQAVSRVAQLALIAAIAAAGGSLLLFTLPAVLAEALMLAWLAPAAHRLVRIRYRPDPGTWWRLFREAAPLSAGAALATIYYRLDSIMLSKLDGFESVGIYGIAYKFVDLTHAVAVAMTTAILPLLVAAWPDRMDAFRATVRRGAVVLGLLAGLIAVEFMLFAGPLIRLLYGPGYVAGADAARITVLSGCLSFVTSLALFVLVAAGRHARYPVIALAGLLVNVALNLALIPRYSYLGAAVATAATDLVVAVWIARTVRRVPGMRPLPRPPLLRLAGTVAAGGAAGWGTWQLLPWPVAVVATAGVYLAAAVLLRAGGPDGLRALRHEPMHAEPAVR